ncbi:cardiolipin synthase [Roseococcus sp. YIM B11640]|uniref:cardiolipin synthase n=1 Tax=Roseococcus sp. YIM B11640 TaxID=3133973 RepID=UPI003C7D5D00
MVVAVAYVLVLMALIARVILRPGRDPVSRLAWIVVILLVPAAGIGGYLLLGETSIGRRRVARLRSAVEALPDPLAGLGPQAEALRPELPPRFQELFRVGRSISRYRVVGGNTARLLPDENQAIDALVGDIDAARDHVHLLFYIWLDDRNGARVAEAVGRAARRGVACRVLVDDVGSRAFIRSAHWRAMREAGARVVASLPVGIAVLRPLHGRIDLRDHRKLAVIDNRITYGGSQNCADPEFRIKARYAPWVDIMLRFEGPLARENQHLFAGDWALWTGEDIGHLLNEPMDKAAGGFAAQVIATGPSSRPFALSEMFQSLIFAARRELIITTPYYVPDSSIQSALRAAGNRGVRTMLVLPARNDSWAVAAASRSHYASLLGAGVAIHEFQGGLLHAKTLTVDGEVALVGSANIDRRSLDLNYENNILLHSPELVAEIRERQLNYAARGQEVHAAEVLQWPILRRLWQNSAAVLSPLL